MYVKFSIKSKKCSFNFVDRYLSFLKTPIRMYELENGS